MFFFYSRNRNWLQLPNMFLFFFYFNNSFFYTYQTRSFVQKLFPGTETFFFVSVPMNKKRAKMFSCAPLDSPPPAWEWLQHYWPPEEVSYGKRISDAASITWSPIVCRLALSYTLAIKSWPLMANQIEHHPFHLFHSNWRGGEKINMLNRWSSTDGVPKHLHQSMKLMLRTLRTEAPHLMLLLIPRRTGEARYTRAIKRKHMKKRK